MPQQPSTFYSGPLSPQQLNLDLYSWNGTGFGSNGILFHSHRPFIFEALNQSRAMTVSTGGTWSVIGGAGTTAFNIIDTGVLFGLGSDGPGNSGDYMFVSNALATSGTGLQPGAVASVQTVPTAGLVGQPNTNQPIFASGCGGYYLAAHFVTAQTATTTPAATGAGLYFSPGFTEVFQAQGGIQPHTLGTQGCAYYLDLVNTGGGSWGLLPSPVAKQQINTMFLPQGNGWVANWAVEILSTASSADVNNFYLMLGTATLATSVNVGVIGTYVQTPATINSPFPGNFLSVTAGSTTPTSATTYGAEIYGSGLPNAPFPSIGNAYTWQPAAMYADASNTSTSAPFNPGDTAGFTPRAAWVWAGVSYQGTLVTGNQNPYAADGNLAGWTGISASLTAAVPPGTPPPQPSGVLVAPSGATPSGASGGPSGINSQWSFTVSGANAGSVSVNGVLYGPNQYFTVSQGQGAVMNAGDLFTDTNNAGVVFTIIAIGLPPAFGFVNVAFYPSAGTNVANPDVITHTAMARTTAPPFPAVAGTQYQVSSTFFPNGAWTAQTGVNWFNTAGSGLTAGLGSSRTLTTAQWAPVTSWLTAPTAAASGVPYAAILNTTASATITTTQTTYLAGITATGQVPAPQVTWTTPITSSLMNGVSGPQQALALLNNPPLLRVAQGLTNSISNSAATTVNFFTTAAVNDSYSAYTPSTGKYIAPLNGIYLSFATFPFTANSTGTRYAGFQVTSGGVTTNMQGPAYSAVGSAAGVTSASAFRVLDLNANDTVIPTCYQNSGGALGLSAGGPGYQSRFGMLYLCPFSSGVKSFTPPLTSFHWFAGAAASDLPGFLAQHLGNDLNFLVSRPYFTGRQTVAQSGLVNGSWNPVTITPGGMIHGSNGDNYAGWSAAGGFYAAPQPGWYLVMAEVYATLPSALTGFISAGIKCSTSGGIAPSTSPDQYQTMFFPQSTAGTPVPGAAAIGCYYLNAGESVQPMIRCSAWGGSFGTFISATVASQFTCLWIAE